MKIGLISDTHGYLDPRLPELFAGVEHILHGGDIGGQRVIHELEQIARVTAVLGNNDAGLAFPETAVIELGRCRFLLHHIVNPRALTDTLRAMLARDHPRVVIFGHTHRPFDETIGGVRFVNPGYAGKARFGLNRTAALAELTDGGCWNVQFFDL